MGLLTRRKKDPGTEVEERSSIDQWITDYLIPAFNYNGQVYPLGVNQTLAGSRAREIAATLPGYARALRACPPAFAAELVRALVLSQARFTFRRKPFVKKDPRRVFGTTELGILDQPWPNGTTGDLLGRMEWHAGLAGNAFVLRQSSRLRLLRPDWTAILYGSQLEPDDPGGALDGEVIGYVYQNGGFTTSSNKPTILFPQDVAHWAPVPDPESPGLGMSWITPAVKDIQADRATTEHKLKFFENGATPNMVVKGLTAYNKKQFDALVDMIEQRHAGVANAYRTLYLTAGADATVVGSNLAEMDFKATQGLGETRIAFLSRVPAPLLGISEGLSGSSLNAGNFAMARRIFADSWVYPTLQNVSACLAPLLSVPLGSELWFDVADVPLLREDAKDAADIEKIKADTIVSLVKEGFEPDSVIAAVTGQNMSLLQHTGLISVQLQTPGAVTPPAIPPADQPAGGSNANP